MGTHLPSLKTETVTTVVKKHALNLSDRAIMEALRALGYDIPDEKVRIFFHVPGGGDYSNEDIEIDRDHPVMIRWETTERMEEVR